VNETEFRAFLWRSTVPLVQLDVKLHPEAAASGCLIDYGGKRILLTVQHATGNQKNWAIQCRYLPDKARTELYQLGRMNFLVKGRLFNSSAELKFDVKEVDFSYVEVPSNVTAYRQEIEASTSSVKSETPIIVHEPSLENMPQLSDTFGFCGAVLHTLEKHSSRVCLGAELRIYSGLSFLRTEEDYHVFKLPFLHPGHEHFKGCSGAPIFSNTGSLVALVCSGKEQTNEIWGISLRALKPPIDISMGKFG
jgi:hypothetical protein